MRRHARTKITVSLLWLVSVTSMAVADVTLPTMFSDHMVLQCDIKLPVWGWADPGEAVTVTLGDQTKSTKASAKGEWSVALAALKAGGPHQLTVKGANTIEIADVLVGEVWLCSGQSNMAMSVSRSANFPAEQAAAQHPKLRMFTVNRETAETPQARCKGSWQVCSPETVGGFSATAYFFGRTLHQKLGVPVGLINSSWGGTPVQAWTSLKAQASLAELKPMLDNWQRQIAYLRSPEGPESLRTATGPMETARSSGQGEKQQGPAPAANTGGAQDQPASAGQPLQRHDRPVGSVRAAGRYLVSRGK